ncbi:helix-turn-helix domain-containing protein [Parapedobacter tibetensis]|uniref:helix-turn-helix domain-containing protein n=1 Tax=Parapedobacter tibetensis TaxID=2972951 RepID=UPI00214DC595|nr:AraC family transcriptional regulator [Parapedobacter tibetensis]
MELFYYPTMSGECVYQSGPDNRFDSIPERMGDFKEGIYTLNTGNLVVAMLKRKFHQPLLITRKALPVNDLYILSFNVTQSGDGPMELGNCYFASATSELRQQKNAGDTQLAIEIHLSRAYLLKILNDLDPNTDSRWVTVLKDNETFQNKVTPFMDDFTILENVFELVEQTNEGQQLNTMLLENKVSALVLSVIEHLLKKNTVNEVSIADTDYKKIKEVQTLIQEDLGNKYRIDELSARCNMCPTKFKQLFKRFTGYSLSSFYNSLRMEQALAWLSTHAQGSISELAYYLGYKSLSHFTTAFKNHYGHAPSIMQKKTAGIRLENSSTETILKYNKSA